MTTPVMTNSQQEKESLNRLGEELLKTKRSLDDMEEQRDMYKHLYYTRLDEVVALLDEVAALKDKLNAIQAITNPDQTQESEQ